MSDPGAQIVGDISQRSRLIVVQEVREISRQVCWVMEWQHQQVLACAESPHWFPLVTKFKQPIGYHWAPAVCKAPIQSEGAKGKNEMGLSWPSTWVTESPQHGEAPLGFFLRWWLLSPLQRHQAAFFPGSSTKDVFSYCCWWSALYFCGKVKVPSGEGQRPGCLESRNSPALRIGLVFKMVGSPSSHPTSFDWHIDWQSQARTHKYLSSKQNPWWGWGVEGKENCNVNLL